MPVCNRFTLTLADREMLALQLGVPVEAIPEEGYRPRYNIAPTDWHWIVRLRREDREVLPARWGLINTWSRDRRLGTRQLNARAETIAERPAFREAFQQRRCAVPADGFFEWTGPRTARRPIWYHRPDGGVMLFAGLYESWRPAEAPADDPWERTFTIVTTAANGLIAPIHDRMPVILPEEAIDDWLFGDERETSELLAMLRPAPDHLLQATYVSPRVNSVRNDDAACLEPAPIQGELGV